MAQKPTPSTGGLLTNRLIIGPFATAPGRIGPNAYQDLAEACDATYERADGTHPLEDAERRMPGQAGYQGPAEPAPVIALPTRKQRSGSARAA